MSAYVLGLLMRTPIPGADPTHKMILGVLEEYIGRADHEDLTMEGLAQRAQASVPTVYRKVNDLIRAGLLKRVERLEGRKKRIEWLVSKERMEALLGLKGEGSQERMRAHVEAAFKLRISQIDKPSQSENSQSDKISQVENDEATQGNSQSENDRHISQSENSQSENDEVRQGDSQSEIADNVRDISPTLSTSSQVVDILPAISKAFPDARIKGQPKHDGTLLAALWRTSPASMRTRSNVADSDKALKAFEKRRPDVQPERVLAAYQTYFANDPDFPRSGGPGLHIWISKKLENWLDDELADELQRSELSASLDGRARQSAGAQRRFGARAQAAVRSAAGGPPPGTPRWDEALGAYRHD